MNRIESVKETILGWLEKIRHTEEGWGLFKYNISALRPYSSESSGVAVTILDQLDALKDIDDEKKRQAVKTIQSWQDEKTGLFIDPLVKESDWVEGWGNHSWDHIWKHNTGVSESALKLLGASPLYKRSEEVWTRFEDAASARGYVLGLDWSNPWRVGEHLATAIQAYVDSRGLSGAEVDDVLEAAFSTYEEKVLDRATGVPSLSFGCPPFRAMAGAFKMLFGYKACGRKYPYTKEAIDSTLALQRPDGAFDEGGACINWDSLCVMKAFSDEIDNSYRFDDIKQAGLKLEQRIRTVYSKPDGAYSFCATKCLEVHNSIKVSEPKPESDVLGTGMYLEVFRYLDEWGL
jgi:hypothetical protein